MLKRGSVERSSSTSSLVAAAHVCDEKTKSHEERSWGAFMGSVPSQGLEGGGGGA